MEPVSLYPDLARPPPRRPWYKTHRPVLDRPCSLLHADTLLRCTLCSLRFSYTTCLHSTLSRYNNYTILSEGTSELSFILYVCIPLLIITMPRGTRSKRVPQRSPSRSPQTHLAASQASPAPAPGTSAANRLASPTAPRPTKKRTVADNAIAIDSINTKLETMSSLLCQVVGSLKPAQADDNRLDRDSGEDIDGFLGSDAQPRARHRSDAIPTDTYSNSRHRFKSASYSATGTGARPHTYSTTRAAPYSRQFDPLAAHPTRRQAPTTLQELDESADLQERVAHLMSAALAPHPHLSGKKLFAHSYIRRGSKKTRTTLGDLTLAEYNLGFMRLLNSREVDPEDRPYMLHHIENVNEDAITYPFSDVRAWSEDICVAIAEGDLTWDDHYKIDISRLKLSQNGPAGRERGDHGLDRRDGDRRATNGGALDPHTDFSAELRAARPGPPCRQYNSGGCSHKSHHVSNGFRQLHICSSCVFHKCLLIPHPITDCKSRDFKKRQPQREPAKEGELGFGK